MAEILGKITGTVIAKLVSVFLPVLLVLFPNNSSLICLDQTLYNNTNVAASKIIAAFEEKNVDALENLMCYNIKQNTENLSDKINEMYSCVEGDIIEFTENMLGFSFSENRGDGNQILQHNFTITILTTQDEYRLSVLWETVNTISPEEAAIRCIVLSRKPETGNIYEHLYTIVATEGVGEWHE